MSDNLPPTKKFKKASTEVSTLKTSNFLNDVAENRNKVSFTSNKLLFVH